MSPSDGIRKLGFRRWYERQLVESHLYLVTFVLALVLVATGFELSEFRAGAANFLFDAVVVAGGSLIAWHAWRRYSTLMVSAEAVGHQAVCPGCERYGFTVDAEDSPLARRPNMLAARCRGCGRRWQVEVDE